MAVKPQAFDQQRSRPAVRQRRYCRLIRSWRWKRLARRMIQRFPICYVCALRLATEVHHIESAADRPDLCYDHANLLTVCRTCHRRIERDGLQRIPERSSPA